MNAAIPPTDRSANAARIKPRRFLRGGVVPEHVWSVMSRSHDAILEELPANRSASRIVQGLRNVLFRRFDIRAEVSWLRASPQPCTQLPAPSPAARAPQDNQAANTRGYRNGQIGSSSNAGRSPDRSVQVAPFIEANGSTGLGSSGGTPDCRHASSVTITRRSLQRWDSIRNVNTHGPHLTTGLSPSDSFSASPSCYGHCSPSSHRSRQLGRQQGCHTVSIVSTT